MLTLVHLGLLASRLVSALTIPTTQLLERASTPTCGKHGYDLSSTSGTQAYFYEAGTALGQSQPACGSRCKAEDKCFSYSVGGGVCMLYAVAVCGNLNPINDSPNAYYDKSCPISTICGVPGYDLLSPQAVVSVTVPSAFSTKGCSAACKTDSKCLSFALSCDACYLYYAPASGNVNAVSTSPITFYDVDCAVPATEPACAVSTTCSSPIAPTAALSSVMGSSSAATPSLNFSSSSSTSPIPTPSVSSSVSETPTPSSQSSVSATLAPSSLLSTSETPVPSSSSSAVPMPTPPSSPSGSETPSPSILPSESPTLIPSSSSVTSKTPSSSPFESLTPTPSQSSSTSETPTPSSSSLKISTPTPPPSTSPTPSPSSDAISSFSSPPTPSSTSSAPTGCPSTSDFRLGVWDVSRQAITRYLGNSRLSPVANAAMTGWNPGAELVTATDLLASRFTFDATGALVIASDPASRAAADTYIYGGIWFGTTAQIAQRSAANNPTAEATCVRDSTVMPNTISCSPKGTDVTRMIRCGGWWYVTARTPSTSCFAVTLTVMDEVCT